MFIVANSKLNTSNQYKVPSNELRFTRFNAYIDLNNRIFVQFLAHMHQ